MINENDTLNENMKSLEEKSLQLNEETMSLDNYDTYIDKITNFTKVKSK